MTTLDELVIELRANTTQVTAGLSTVTKQLNELAGQATKMGGEVEKSLKSTHEATERAREGFKHLTESILEAMGIRFAVNGLIEFTKQALESADRMVTMSKQTGIAVETLQGLNYVATVSGTNVEALSTSVAFMNRTIGEAASGNKTAQQAVAQLGLSFRTLAAESPEQQFTVLVDRINSLSSQSEKAKAATEIFGRSWRDLAEVMSLGGKGIEEGIDQAHRLGLVLSGEDLEKIKAFNDEMATTKLRAQTLAQEGFVVLLDAMKTDRFQRLEADAVDLVHTMSTALTPALQEAGKAVAYLVEQTIDRLDTGLKVISGLMKDIAVAAGTLSIRNRELFGSIDHDTADEAIKGLREEFTKTAPAAQAANDNVEKLAAGTAHLRDVATDGAKAMSEVNKGLDDMNRAALADVLKTGDDPIKNAVIDVDKAVGDLAEQYKKATGHVLEFNQAQKGEIQQITDKREEAAAWQEIQKAIDDTRTPLEKYQHGVDQLNEAMETLKRVSPESLSPEAIEAVRREMQKLADDTDQSAKVFEDFAKSVSDSISDAFKDVLDGKFDGIFDSFIDAFKTMLAKLAALAIAEPIVIPMAVSLGNAAGLGTGALNGIVKQLGGSGSVGTDGSYTSMLSGAGSLASGAGMLGGITSAINGFGAAHFGMAASSGEAELFGSGGLSSATLTGTLGAAGIGALGGNMLAGLLNLNKTGGTIGGGVGAGVGMAFGGPLGALAGGALGSLAGGVLGKAFGSRAHPTSSFSTDDGFSTTDLQSKHMTTDFASGLADSVKAALAQLTASGLNTSWIKSIQGGVDDGRGFLSTGDWTKGGADTIGFDPSNPDAGLAKFLKLVVNNSGDLSKVMDADLIPSLKNLSAEGKSSAQVLQEIVSDLTRDDLRKQMVTATQDSILEILSPGYTAMKQESAQYQANLAQAKSLGESTAQIAQVTLEHNLRVKQLQASNNVAQQEAIQNATTLVQRYGQISTGFDGLLAELRNGRYSTLSPTANLADLRSQVQTTGAAARLGDATAQEQLLTLLPQFLDLSAQVNGYNADYAKDQGTASDLATAAKSVADRQLDVQQGILDAATKQTSLLEQLTGGAGAGGNANDKLVKALASGYAGLANDQLDAIFSNAGVTVAPGNGRRTSFLNDPTNAGINSSLNSIFHALGVPGFSQGGWITGGVSGRDSVPTLHMPGEFTLRASAAARLGAPALDFMNRTGTVPANDNRGDMAALGQRIDRLTNVVMAIGQQTTDHLGGIRGATAVTARASDRFR